MNRFLTPFFDEAFSAAGLDTRRFSFAAFTVLKYSLVGFFVLAGLFTAFNAAHAATYAADNMSGSAHVEVASGQSAQVQLRLKNTGDTTWIKEGGAYISAYTWAPKYHVSPYRGPAWWSDHQTGQLLESSVAPGETGTFLMTVYGPPGFTGDLDQTFRLAAEETAWLEGGIFTVSMKVVDASEVKEDVVTEDVEVDAASGELGATVLIRSATSVVARANQSVSYRVGIKNSGTVAWNSYAVESASTSLASQDDVSFYHPSWSASGVALALADTSVAPGRMEMMQFSFRAPHVQGSYTARFQLTANGVAIPGGEIEIPVEVTSNAQAMLDAPVDEEKELGPVKTGVTIEEPRVRVGIDRPEGETVFVATEDVTVVESDMGYERYVIPAGQRMRVNYNGEKYVFSSGDILHVADSYLRFEGASADTIFTVESFSDVRSWNTSLNDNRFRDTLELRYNSKKDRTWLINELPIEYYLYGVDESSNTAPVEYHKALVTAARTYALYAWEHKAKYAGEFIDLRSTTYDQVYHGYGAEIRRPNWVSAAKATEGVSVTYEGETIIASYFSRSNGRTKSWSDVWGRSVPYAVSVEVPCEVGQTMWGHGVGLSALGAACMAEEEGKTFDEILTHFYTGVELHDRW